MSVLILLAPALAAAAQSPPPEPSGELSQAHRPGLGLQVRSVEIDTGPEHYRLTERSWDDVVRDNPALFADQRRAELFAPGVAGLSLGALWLSISSAVTIDQLARQRREEERSVYSSHGNDDPVLSARAVTFRFILPSALVVAGAALTIAGGRARRRLESARRAYFLSPQISRGGGGLTIGGRF